MNMKGNKANERIITKDELQIILSQLDEIKISFPFYPKFDILIARPEDVGYEIKILSGEYDFIEELSDFGAYDKEMPNYSDFRNCLLSSGILEHTNKSEFEGMLSSYRKMKKRVIFCPDTNIIYNRFISSSSLFKQNEILLIDTVKKELEASLNYKYDKRLQQIKNHIRHQSSLLDELVNKRIKKSRIAAYVGLREYKEVKKIALEVKGIEKSTGDNEQNDRIIVNTVKQFGKERDFLPVLMTADIPMVDLCELEGLEYFLFEIPRAPDAKYSTPAQMIELTYIMSTVFGLIKLNSFIIFGEFRGKSRYEELKIRFLDDSKLSQFEKDLKLCRELLKLGIEN